VAQEVSRGGLAACLIQKLENIINKFSALMDTCDKLQEVQA
jgi:hypothetical protein